MIRTQIYLAEEEKAKLKALATQTGRKQSALIRQAVDDLLARYHEDARERSLSRAAGLWRIRGDLPDFSALREEWDVSIQ